jgi:serine/threonine-protein kinase CLA4
MVDVSKSLLQISKDVCILRRYSPNIDLNSKGHVAVAVQAIDRVAPPSSPSQRAEFEMDKLAPIHARIADEIGVEENEEDKEDPDSATATRATRPRTVVSGIGLSSAPNAGRTEDGRVSPISSASSSAPSSALSPAEQQYRGWVFDVLAPLLPFIDDTVEPQARYSDLQEIGEGESGSVFSARVRPDSSLASSAKQKKRRKDVSPSAHATVVAVKVIPVDPAGSPKIELLRQELELMEDVRHAHVLTMDALFIDLSDDTLWIRMELMETSLADVIGLVDEGAEMGEPVIARFASDVSFLRLACSI